MDDLKSDFSQNRGTYITCGVLSLLSFFGGVMAILGPKIGEGNAALLGLGVIIFTILIIIASIKGFRPAKIILGVFLLIVGLGSMIFFLHDFVTSLLTGESRFNKGSTAENYGTQMFIFTAFGFGIFGIGLALLGIIK